MNRRNVPRSGRLDKGIVGPSSAGGPSSALLAVALAAASLAVAPPVWAKGDTSPTAWAAAHVDSLVDLYQALHRAPELSFHEEKTAARLADQLRAVGADVTTGVGGHGVVGVLKNGNGKVLMLRTDLDALPVAEQTGLPYASPVRVRDERGATVGVMHACGHDLHIANLVGVARYLASHRERWSGTVVLVGQPAEERGAGAAAMLADGLFARFPRPHFAVAMHVSSDTPTGQIGYHAGYSQANVDSVDIVVHGRGGHGAYPETTIDPVVIAARLVLDLQTIVSREVQPTAPAVVTVGSIHGGTKHNVISDQCRLQLTVRSYSPKVRKQLHDAIRRKALAAAASAGAAEPDVDISEGTPALYNDPELTARIAATLERLLGEANVVEFEPTMGGEDFGRYGLAGVPISMLKLGGVNEQRLDQLTANGEPPPSLHSPLFYPDAREALQVGVASMATIAIDLLPPETHSTQGE